MGALHIVASIASISLLAGLGYEWTLTTFIRGNFPKLNSESYLLKGDLFP